MAGDLAEVVSNATPYVGYGIIVASSVLSAFCAGSIVARTYTKYSNRLLAHNAAEFETLERRYEQADDVDDLMSLYHDVDAYLFRHITDETKDRAFRLKRRIEPDIPSEVVEAYKMMPRFSLVDQTDV
tara:strand:+ start:144 stop:527 length:384 start_codon:yes stop_codon:yes gene_type:complete